MRRPKHENLIRDPFLNPNMRRNLSLVLLLLLSILLSELVCSLGGFSFSCLPSCVPFGLLWRMGASTCVCVCVCVCVRGCVEKMSESSVRRIRLFISNCTRNRASSLNAVFRIACEFEFHAGSTLSCCLRVPWQRLASRRPQEKYCHG